MYLYAEYIAHGHSDILISAKRIHLPLIYIHAQWRSIFGDPCQWHTLPGPSLVTVVFYRCSSSQSSSNTAYPYPQSRLLPPLKACRTWMMAIRVAHGLSPPPNLHPNLIPPVAPTVAPSTPLPLAHILSSLVVVQFAQLVEEEIVIMSSNHTNIYENCLYVVPHRIHHQISNAWV